MGQILLFYYLITRLSSPLDYELLKDRNYNLIVAESLEPGIGLTYSRFSMFAEKKRQDSRSDSSFCPW